MNVIAFAIETVPDTEAGQAIYDLKGLDEKGSAKAMLHLQQQKTGDTELPLYLQKIVSLSMICREGQNNTQAVTVESLDSNKSNEKEIIQLFYDKIESLKPQLVSWSGTTNELALLHYRSLKNSLVLPAFWKEGDYHHYDLQFLLCSYNFENTAPQSHIAKLLGLPDQTELESSEIWKKYLNGTIEEITHNCEINALNTYLIYLHYEFMRGEIEQETLEKENQRLRDFLLNSGQNHHLEFVESWAN